MIAHCGNRTISLTPSCPAQVQQRLKSSVNKDKNVLIKRNKKKEIHTLGSQVFYPDQQSMFKIGDLLIKKSFLKYNIVFLEVELKEKTGFEFEKCDDFTFKNNYFQLSLGITLIYSNNLT